jgi:hypothetical protein
VTRRRRRVLTERHLPSPNPDWAVCGTRLRTDVRDRGEAWFEGRMQDVGYTLVHRLAEGDEAVTCPACQPRW